MSLTSLLLILHTVLRLTECGITDYESQCGSILASVVVE